MKKNICFTIVGFILFGLVFKYIYDTYYADII